MLPRSRIRPFYFSSSRRRLRIVRNIAIFFTKKTLLATFNPIIEPKASRPSSLSLILLIGLVNNFTLLRVRWYDPKTSSAISRILLFSLFDNIYISLI